MSYYTVDDQINDHNRLFNVTSEYAEKLLGKTGYNPLWVVVITWQDVRPYNPGSFCGVS